LAKIEFLMTLKFFESFQDENIQTQFIFHQIAFWEVISIFKFMKNILEKQTYNLTQNEKFKKFDRKIEQKNSSQKSLSFELETINCADVFASLTRLID
jgi:hypothetical protein